MESEKLKSTRQLLTLGQAVGVRLVFLLHCLLAISRVSDILNKPLFWIYSLFVLFLILEGIHAVFRREGLEHKWVSLGTLIFILLDIGPIWIMELDKADRASGRISKTSNGGGSNTTSQNLLNRNFISLDDDVFVYAIEQSFLLVMIIGRWALPKGQMSRDKLSNLLLVMIGKACDITDFFTLFSHKNVALDRTFTHVVLVVWSLSVFQFPISFTESRNDNVAISIHRDRQYMKIIVRTLNVCFKTEIWSILAAIFMQEFPFLVCRSYAVGALGIVNDSIIFFLFKNSLIISMYTYRLVSLCLEMDPYSDLRTAVVETEITNGRQTMTIQGIDDEEEIVTLDISANKQSEVDSRPNETHHQNFQENDYQQQTMNVKTVNKRIKPKICPENVKDS
eukprot:XP_011452636.1 PREDICTED: transmembrane protein 26-like [Crassostrea gigas]